MNMMLALDKSETKKENIKELSKEKEKKKNKLIELEEEHAGPKKKLKLYVS